MRETTQRWRLRMVVVDVDKCVGCGVCTHFCPMDALEAWGVTVVNRDKCSGCLDCVEACPVDALEVEE